MPIAIDSRFAEVNGIRLHYLAAGKGNAVLLLHGYAQTSHMWRPLIGELAKSRTVIAPDLRGFGQSSKPLDTPDHAGSSKRAKARDCIALMRKLSEKSRDRWRFRSGTTILKRWPRWARNWPTSSASAWSISTLAVP